MGAQWMSKKRARAVQENCPDGTAFSRSAYLRDYGFLTHSTIFRRLSHKTQIYSMSKSDHTRTRLTHSVEVSQVGAQLAGYFSKKLSEMNLIKSDDGSFSDDLKFLTMSACLAHDFGHPPFGQKGTSLLEVYAKEVDSEFDNDKQMAHVLISPVLYEDIDLSAPLVASTFKTTKLNDIGYSEDRKLISQLLEALNLKDYRHPASLLVEAADDIASMAADLEDYLRYFSKESPKELIKNFNIGDLTALDENYMPIGRLDQVLLGHLKDEGEERYQMAVGMVVRSLLFYTCKHLDRFFQQQTFKNINDIPRALTEYANKNGFSGEQSPLYFNNLDGDDRGGMIKKFKSDLYDQVLDQSQIGHQDILAKKVFEELWPLLKPLTTQGFASSDVFKILSSTQKGLFIAASHNEQGYTLNRALLDYISGMTDRYAVALWKKLTDPLSSAA